MSKLIELRRQYAEVIEKMEAILQAAGSGDEARSFTDDEETQYKALEESLPGITADISTEEKREQRSQFVVDERTALGKISNSTGTRIEIDKGTDGEFRDLGEFVAAVAFNPGDSRLKSLAATESREQVMKDGTKGGFMVPPQFREGIMSVKPQEATVRPRATVIPAGSPPDAEITFNALDQGASKNMYGGVIVYHQGEVDTLTESTAEFRQVTMKPKKLTAYMTESNELLANWQAGAAFFQTQMRLAVIGAEDTDFYSGDGVNKALGLLNLPAAIDYNRAVANEIAYADVYNMYSRLLRRGGSPVWVASQTTLPQLIQIRDLSSASVWQPSAREGEPDRLLGIPLKFSERAPAIGSKGDLGLFDMSNYLIKDGSGPALAVSEHVEFAKDKTAFRLTWRVDGQSWLNAPIGLEGSTANTVSPFIILDTP